MKRSMLSLSLLLLYRQVLVWQRVLMAIFDLYALHRVLNEMSHVDQYGFRYQFNSDENQALHYLCQQLHLHYSARRAVSKSSISRWQHLLSATTSPLCLPITNKVDANTSLCILLKPGFHYPSWRPELTARVDGFHYPSTRARGFH